MTTKQTIILFAALGAFALALQKEWVIIRLPSFGPEQSNHQGAEKRSATLYFWRNERWVQESVEVIWSAQDTAQTIKYLLDRWLTWLDEEASLVERMCDKKVTLQTVMITPNGQEAILSFDRSPFGAEMAAYEQWKWVESVLKTIRDNGIKVQRIRFLVHHQEVLESRLDLSNPWPLLGFGDTKT